MRKGWLLLALLSFSCASLPRTQEPVVLSRAEQEEAAFQAAESKGTAEAYQEFALRFRTSALAPEARRRAKDASYRHRRAAGVPALASSIDEGFAALTSDYAHLSPREFLDRYGMHRYDLPISDPALKQEYAQKLHTVILQVLVQQDSLDYWLGYLSVYPDTPYLARTAKETERLLISQARGALASNRLRVYLQLYAKNNRTCKNADALQRLVVDYAVQRKDSPALQAFVTDFPDSPHRGRAQTELDRLQRDYDAYQSVIHSSAAQLEEFIKQNPGNAYVPEAQRRLAEIKGLRASGIMPGVPAPPPPLPASFLEARHWVKAIGESGKYVALEDDSVWEVTPLDQIESGHWAPFSDISVKASHDVLFPYKLINVKSQESVYVKPVQAGKAAAGR